MFCNECGKEIPDNVAFCPECGSKVTKDASAAPANNKVCSKCGKSVSVYDEFCPECGAQIKVKKSKGAKTTILIMAIIVAVIVLAVVFFVAKAFFSTPNSVVSKTMKSFINNKPNLIMDVIPGPVLESIYENIEDFGYADNKKEAKDYYLSQKKRNMKLTRNNLEEEYDTDFDDIKISYRITDSDNLDKDDLEDLNDQIAESYDKKMKVSAAKELTVKYTIKADGDKERDETEITVVKIGNKWYLGPNYWY